MNVSLKAKTFLTSTLCFLLLIGCGGGTSGSGLNTYEGRVSSTDGEALSNVLVTIESTGDSSTTNATGNFSMNSGASGAEVPFLIESPQFISRFSVKNIPNENSRVKVDVTVDTLRDTAQVTNFSVRAGMVGVCDGYFDDSEVIRQTSRVPDGTICSVKVRLLGDGAPAGRLPVAVQYSSCEPNAVWETLATSETGIGIYRGVAEVHFPFRNNSTFCRYRVVAPFNLQDVFPVFYPIDTFSAQEYDDNNKSRSWGHSKE